jgi:hypothetical protein
MNKGDAQMTYTFSTELFSDLHKDVYGFRPRGHWFYDANTTDQERQEEWDYLCNRLNEQIVEDNARKAQALRDLHTRVAELRAAGAEDDHQALKWIVQSLNPSQSDLWYGGEWVCYELGLGYDCGYMFNKVCRELELELEELDSDADRHYYAMSFEE